jgi:hypothetical protein
MVFQRFHLLGIDTDPVRPYAELRIRPDRNIDLPAIFSRATVPVGDKPDD